jgi:hypothetical protein
MRGRLSVPAVATARASCLSQAATPISPLFVEAAMRWTSSSVEMGQRRLRTVADQRAVGIEVVRPSRPAATRSGGLLARMSPEASPPIKLRPAGALIPPPHGQKNHSPDREDHEIARHDTFRGARQARRSPYEDHYMRVDPAATRASVALTPPF